MESLFFVHDFKVENSVLVLGMVVSLLSTNCANPHEFLLGGFENN